MTPGPTTCKCCYCGRDQVVPEPPSLVNCLGCGKPFRVIERERGSVTLRGSVECDVVQPSPLTPPLFRRSV
jgi:hypothetical protein